MDNQESETQSFPVFKKKVVKAGNGSEEVFLPLMMESLPEEFRLKAKNELNETEEDRIKGLKKLKDYAKKENLNVNPEDEFLLSFLRAGKFNTKKAEQRLKRFPTLMKVIKSLLEATDMERIKHVIDHQMTGLLPYRDKHGRAIIYTRGYAWNKELFDLNDVAACMLSFVLFASSYPLTSISGICYIPEAKVNSLYDLIPMGNIIRNYAPYMNSFPIRFQRIDLLNENYLCRYFYMLIKPLLSKKLTKRAFLHGSDPETLFKGYPPSILPFEFGGTLGPLSPEWYREKFLEFVQKVKSEGFYGI